MSDTAAPSQASYIENTVDVVAAYVSNNSIPTTELPALIASVHEVLNAIAAGTTKPEVETVEKPSPAQIRKSIRPDGLISFIDGKSYKTLKRHLTKHGLDPQSYRERYGLPADYPTTSANYSAQRSALAKSLGLGQPGRAVAPGEPEPEPEPVRTRRKGGTTGSKGRSRKPAEVA
ncbi:MucR family transcriptional regulator [Methylobacterium radiodurans]|uniref:MucR family transcriptional regulator n=1 Tax=Methylobacterium radiodurans TaxID=2202828 RepID=A0A2U8VN32_9HYPH|nr:MucR family transcriptional regulator [Methylobacterium radiodurans]AWN34841.1 MucR family transcriptional regulator [Methylobacterium radiodurans]